MARRYNGLRAQVEQQSGACRQLAICLSDYVDGNRMLLAAEKKILGGYADSLASIADGLTEALAVEDRSALDRLWRWAPVAAGTVLTAMAAGGAEGISGALLDPEPAVERCVAIVIDLSDEPLRPFGPADQVEVDPRPLQPSGRASAGDGGLDEPTEAKVPTAGEPQRLSAADLVEAEAQLSQPLAPPQARGETLGRPAGQVPPMVDSEEAAPEVHADAEQSEQELPSNPTSERSLPRNRAVIDTSRAVPASVAAASDVDAYEEIYARDDKADGFLGAIGSALGRRRRND